VPCAYRVSFSLTLLKPAVKHEIFNEQRTRSSYRSTCYRTLRPETLALHWLFARLCLVYFTVVGGHC
jgi:hypothetical protein